MTKPVNIEVKNLDHLGIIAGIIDELDIVKIVNERVGIEAQEKINSGQIVKAIIISCTSNNRNSKRILARPSSRPKTIRNQLNL